MSYQKDIFGESDKRQDLILSHVTGREYEGSTPSELAQSLRMRIGKVKEHLGVLMAMRKVVVCGERQATVKAKRIEQVYKAVRYATQPKPKPKGKQKLEDTEHVKIVEVAYARPSRETCPACNADVVVIDDVMCDPQKRYVIFDGPYDKDGLPLDGLSGFEEDTKKLVLGRPATRGEAVELRQRKSCGKPWTIVRDGHLKTCTGTLEKWNEIHGQEGRPEIEWEEIRKACIEEVDSKATDERCDEAVQGAV